VKRSLGLALTAVNVAALLAAVVLATSASAADDGRTVVLDRTEANLGEHVAVTIDGFQARSVTISICGNEGRRGSSDCNMAESEAVRLSPASSTVADMPVAAPPVPCPCIVFVASAGSAETAIAPITVLGHPVGPVVGSAAPTNPLEVTIEATRVDGGLLARARASLAGPTAYEVTVRVRNISDEPIGRLRIAGAAGRDADDDTVTMSFPAIDEIAPGATAEQTVRTELPALMTGDVTWHASITGAGAAVTVTDSTGNVPVLLYVVLVLIGLDGIVLLARLRRRRRTRRRTARTTRASAAPASVAT
jgi:hypothetical protein